MFGYKQALFNNDLLDYCNYIQYFPKCWYVKKYCSKIFEKIEKWSFTIPKVVKYIFKTSNDDYSKLIEIADTTGHNLRGLASAF